MDSGLDRRVALKLLRTSRAGHGAAGQRLQREAQALARLSHPNVVTVETGERERAMALVTQACDVFIARKRARDLTELAGWLRPRGASGKNARCVTR